MFYVCGAIRGEKREREEGDRNNVVEKKKKCSLYFVI